MAEYNFQVRGWGAVAAIAGLLLYWGVQVRLRMVPVDDAMREAVRAELLNEYSGRGSKDVARLVAEARAGSPVEPLPDVVQRDVEFNSIAARGHMGAQITLIRADLTVDGGPPPDGHAVRYFRLSRKFIGGGWMVVGESDSYNYFMQLVP